MKAVSGFWSFDWLIGKMKLGNGEDLYGPQDGQFMIFGQYPYSRSRNRVLSQRELEHRREMSEEEKQARLEGLQRVAISNYENEQYYKNCGIKRYNYKNRKVYPFYTF